MVMTSKYISIATVAFLFLYINSLIPQGGGEDGKDAYLIFVHVSSSIDEDIVATSYEDISTIQQCGLKCRKLDVDAVSFYYIESESACYCNNQTDENIAIDDNGGTMVYGQLMPRLGKSSECQEIYNDGFRIDWIYIVQPGNEFVYCELTSLGWVVFQRRMDGSVNFYRNWTEYVDGFGDPNGEFWLGLEALHQATATGCELNIYLKAEPSNPDQAKGYAYYSSFSVGSATTNYVLNETGFVGNVGDCLRYHNGYQFTTYDVDNDNKTFKNCAVDSRGGWWYNRCHMSNLNGVYNSSSYGDGINWINPWGFYYSLKRTEMAFRC